MKRGNKPACWPTSCMLKHQSWQIHFYVRFAFIYSRYQSTFFFFFWYMGLQMEPYGVCLWCDLCERVCCQIGTKKRMKYTLVFLELVAWKRLDHSVYALARPRPLQKIPRTTSDHLLLHPHNTDMTTTRHEVALPSCAFTRTLHDNVRYSWNMAIDKGLRCPPLLLNLSHTHRFTCQNWQT